MWNVCAQRAAWIAALSALGLAGCSAQFNNPANKPLANAPAILSVSPAAGPISGNTQITITGINFIGPAVVTVGGSQCLNPQVLPGGTTIRCTTFAHGAAAVDVTVTDADGQAATLAGGYTYQIAPIPILMSPSGGPLSGGEVVTIMGVGFVPGAMVSLGGNACANPVVLSPTSLTCTTLAHAGGAVDVTVTNADTQSGTLTNAFTYQSGPTISAITPSSGALIGGTSVTLTVGNVLPGFSVDIGGSPCNINALSTLLPTKIVCTTTFYSSASAVTVNVNVHNPDGQIATLTNGYTYQPAPTVSSITKNAGPLAGGNSVTITGTNFLAGLGVAVGTAPCAITTFTPPTTIICTIGAPAPALVSSTQVNVVVTNPDTQTGTLANGYTFEPAPTISGGGISPASGPSAGGTQVTITGTGFITGATVSFGGSTCGVTSISATQIICTTTSYATASAAAVSVVVTNPDTQNSSGTPATYTYVPKPSVASISPYPGGALHGANSITVNGSNFITTGGGPTVTIGGVACTVTAFTTTTVTCTAPDSLSVSQVTRSLVVTNPDGQASAGFSYTYEPAPSVGSISPYAGGPVNGGNSITINGANFITGATVAIGAGSCAITALTASAITCTVPSLGASGTKAVLVQNPDGQNSSATPINYVYEPAPAVTTISPYPGGPLAGANNITITGTNFMTGATVAINGVNCPVAGAPAPTATSMVCTVPNSGSATQVTYNLVVTNPDTQTSTPVSYTYEKPPGTFTVSPTSGYSSGGTAVTITGSNFISGATVSFGGSACTVTTLSATQIQCTTTAYATGAAVAVNVTVTNPDNQFVTVTAAYTYVPPPSVSGITPYAGGPQAGLNSITITGSNFITTPANPTVTIGGLGCAVTAATATSVTCTVPAPSPAVTGNSTASKAVLVTNADGQTSAATPINYTYEPAPSITSLTTTPGNYAGGALAGANTLTITGANFITTPLPGVKVGTYTCTATAATATSITCTMPNPISPAAAAGTVNVVVTNADAQASAASTYHFDPAPTISTITTSPGSYAGGPLAGGNTVIITGTGYITSPVPTVSIGAYACTVSAVTATQITCSLGAIAAAAGAVNVVVTNADNQSATAVNGYSFDPAPTITSLTTSPGNYPGGPLAGGNTVVITGTGYLASPLPTVKIGAYTCTVSAATATQITCALGAIAAAAGAVNVVVTNADNQAVTSVNGYTFEVAPALTSLRTALGNYAGGPLAGGGTLQITGTGFITSPVPTVTVSVGATNYTCTVTGVPTATSVNCNLQAITPALAATTAATVTVTNADNQPSGTLAYTFEPVPTITGISPSAGPSAGGTVVTISSSSGSFIQGPGAVNPTVTIGGAACTPVTWTSTGQISCPSPAGTGGTAGAVVVTNPDGQNFTWNSFSWNSPASLVYQIGAAAPYTYSPPSAGTDTLATVYNTNASWIYTILNQGGSTSGAISVYVANNTMQITGYLTPGSTTISTINGTTAFPTTGLVAGMGVSGTGIQAGTTIATVGSSSITLSLASNIGVAGSQLLTFSNLTGTGTATNGSNTVTALAICPSLSNGMYVDGPGIPDGTTITSTPIAGCTSITLSNNAGSMAAAGETLTFTTSKSRLFSATNTCGTLPYNNTCTATVTFNAGNWNTPAGTFQGTLYVVTPGTGNGANSPGIAMVITRTSGYTWSQSTTYSTSTLASAAPAANSACYQKGATIAGSVVNTGATGTQVQMTYLSSQNTICNGVTANSPAPGTSVPYYYGLTGCVQQCGGGTTPAGPGGGSGNCAAGTYPSANNNHTCTNITTPTSIWTNFYTGAPALQSGGCDTTYQYIVQNYTCQ